MIDVDDNVPMGGSHPAGEQESETFDAAQMGTHGVDPLLRGLVFVHAIQIEADFVQSHEDGNGLFADQVAGLSDRRGHRFAEIFFGGSFTPPGPSLLCAIDGYLDQVFTNEREFEDPAAYLRGNFREEWALGLHVGAQSRSRRRETLQGVRAIEQLSYGRNGPRERPIGKTGTVQPLARPFEFGWRADGVPEAIERLLELLVVDEARPCDGEEAEAEDEAAVSL